MRTSLTILLLTTAALATTAAPAAAAAPPATLDATSGDAHAADAVYVCSAPSTVRSIATGQGSVLGTVCDNGEFLREAFVAHGFPASMGEWHGRFQSWLRHDGGERGLECVYSPGSAAQCRSLGGSFPAMGARFEHVCYAFLEHGPAPIALHDWACQVTAGPRVGGGSAPERGIVADCDDPLASCGADVNGGSLPAACSVDISVTEEGVHKRVGDCGSEALMVANVEGNGSCSWDAAWDRCMRATAHAADDDGPLGTDCRVAGDISVNEEGVPMYSGPNVVGCGAGGGGSGLPRADVEASATGSTTSDNDGEYKFKKVPRAFARAGGVTVDCSVPVEATVGADGSVDPRVATDCR